MQSLARFVISATLVSFAGTSCAAGPYDRLANHAVYMCRKIASPDASKDHGEVGFWFQADRAKTSRKLWNPAGLRVINRLLGKVSDPSDRKCLEQLQQEASTHKLVRE
jgi:hypothetical protein